MKKHKQKLLLLLFSFLLFSCSQGENSIQEGNVIESNSGNTSIVSPLESTDLGGGSSVSTEQSGTRDNLIN